MKLSKAYASSLVGAMCIGLLSTLSTTVGAQANIEPYQLSCDSSREEVEKALMLGASALDITNQLAECNSEQGKSAKDDDIFDTYWEEIEACGYHRRDEELADAVAASENW